MKSKMMFQAAVGMCTAALIAGCGQQPSAPQTQAYRPAYVLSVDLAPGDTAQSLEASHHGHVMAFDSKAGYALIGMDAAAARQLNARRVGALALTPGAEKNIGAFNGGGMTATMNGAVRLWAGGAVRLWAGGAVRLWAGGTYANVPENSGTFDQIKLQAAQTAAPNLGKGVKVAVIDTGLDLSHPAFSGSLDLANAKDYVDGDGVPQDVGTLGVGGYGHGTSVASIVLQVAPNATILPIRVLGSDGSGDVASVALAIRYAAERGAKIINLSLGSTERSDIVQQAIAYASGPSFNAVVISSAGNDNTGTLTYPAMLADDKGPAGDRGLSVGSVGATDRKSSFSNYATDLEMTAPGENIASAAPDGMMVSWSGTSMAAPMVSGGIALALGQLPTADTKAVTQKMEDNGLSIDNLNTAYQGKLGKGRLDLQKFLSAVLPR